jgi:hypothetical protein
MSRKEPELTSLAARKQLLLLESELNRVYLCEAVHELKLEILRSKQRLSELGTVASTATKLLTTVSTASRLLSRRQTDGQRSWLSFLFDGLTTGTSLWLLLRSNHKKSE